VHAPNISLLQPLFSEIEFRHSFPAYAFAVDFSDLVALIRLVQNAQKSMLHREVPLTIEDFLYSPGAAVYNETAASIDTYFIAEAIRTAYPESVKSIFANSNITYPAIPAVELLEPRKTDSKTLGPILFNEGTLDSSYEVI
jgi:hypothetical protein